MIVRDQDVIEPIREIVIAVTIDAIGILVTNDRIDHDARVSCFYQQASMTVVADSYPITRISLAPARNFGGKERRESIAGAVLNSELFPNVLERLRLELHFEELIECR